MCTKKTLLACLAGCCMFISCGESITKMKMPPYVLSEYGRNVNKNIPYWINYEINTPNRYSAAQLSLIAADIRKNTDIKYTILWINYHDSNDDPYANSYINEEETYTKLWKKEESDSENVQAETNTEIETQPKQTTQTARQSPSAPRDIVGQFQNQYGVYVIYQANGKYYMDNKFSDGSGSTDALETKTRNGKWTFNVVGDPYEYFEMRNGNLYIYDADGNLGLIYDGI